MTTTLMVTAQGELVLGSSVMEHLGVRPGDTLEVDLLSDGRVALRAAGNQPPSAQRQPLSRLWGVLKRPGQPSVSIADMQEAIEKEAGS